MSILDVDAPWVASWPASLTAHQKPLVLESYYDQRHPVAESLIPGTNFTHTALLHPSHLEQRRRPGPETR